MSSAVTHLAPPSLCQAAAKRTVPERAPIASQVELTNSMDIARPACLPRKGGREGGGGSRRSLNPRGPLLFTPGYNGLVVYQRVSKSIVATPTLKGKTEDVRIADRT